MSSIQKRFSIAAASFGTKLLIITIAAIGGGALISSSVVAALQAGAFNATPHSIGSGTLKLTMAPSSVAGITGGFSTAMAGMAPGDVVNRYVDLTNGGTLDATLPTMQVTPVTSSKLDSDGTNGLQVSVNACSVAWTNTGTCSGTTTAVLASTSVLNLATAKAITLPSMVSGAVNQLKISVSLPSGSETVSNGTLPVGTIQGLTSSLTWTFQEQQRNSVTTHS